MKKKKSAAADWKHPRLGTFKADGCGWSMTVNVPAFAAFSYDTGYPNAPRSTGNVGLSMRYFRADAEAPPTPTPEMVALLDKVMFDPSAFVNTVITGLWEDFNGSGPDSGVWWHDNMKTINKSFGAARLPPPKHAEDLLPALQLTDVTVWNEWWDYPAPIVYLDFHAAFEEEHGVSMLSNVDELLGTGFGNGEVNLWKHLRPKRPPLKNPFL